MTGQVFDKTPSVLIAGADNLLGQEIRKVFIDAGAMVATLNVDAFLDSNADSDDPENSVAGALQSLVAAELDNLDTLIINTEGSVDDIDHWDDDPQYWIDALTAGPRLAVQLLAAALPSLGESSEANVVITTSTAGWTGDALDPAAAVSSSSLLGICRVAAREMGSDGVRVNLVAFDSEKQKSASNRALVHQVQEDDEIGDVAKAVMLLSSPLAQSVSGQALIANGGGLFI